MCGDLSARDVVEDITCSLSYVILLSVVLNNCETTVVTEASFVPKHIVIKLIYGLTLSADQ